MNKNEHEILDMFKNSKGPLCADDIAKQIFAKEYKEAVELTNNVDKKKITQGLDKKFKLHRRILYYLNKLESANIIRTTSYQQNGEKYFELEDKDVILESGYKKIFLKANNHINIISKYESANLMKRFSEDSTNPDSIILFPELQGLNKQYYIIKECLKYVNDAIGIYNFEIIIAKTLATSEGKESIKSFINKINNDTLDFNKTISIIINPIPEILEFFEIFTKINPKNINIVFNVNSKVIQKNNYLFEQIIKLFSENKIKIYLKNIDLSQTPIFKGRAGIYTFDDKEWQEYEHSEEKNFGLICAQSTIAINVDKLTNKQFNSEFRNSVLQASKSLLISNSANKVRINAIFKTITKIKGTNDHGLKNKQISFYNFSRNYIRFWNYDLEKNPNIIDLMNSTKELVDGFSRSEETIFKSCGIPLRFKIAFSSAFKNFDPVFCGERNYHKTTINKLEDFYSKENKNLIINKEKLLEIFDGGDRFRIFRNGNFETREIIHEFNMLLSTYKIPLITYDFSNIRDTTKLTQFI